MTDQDVNPQVRKKNQNMIMLIIGMPIILILLSYTLMHMVKTGKLDLVGMLGTQTVGQLMDPVQPIADLSLTRTDGQPFVYDDEKPMFSLLVLDSPSCGKRCADNLHLSRQMHIALGKLQGKLRRYHVYLDGTLSTSQLESLKKDYPHLLNLYGSSANVEKVIANQSLELDNLAYLLVDHRGWVMMAYPETIGEKHMMSDLKHLFKYAQ
ncbi:Uncharacterised protein [BD1-7 clade bacterium]|uniref:Thioredoxin domain-containing protein n=1 Tax=BD1-7 clade bacterium TaxID=2029982 RepID=A0A5S9MUE2_9GAMM|nr:Uncharacterised protein [BD1-7 clade bacterium]CAA0083555.1 Uncharacterised protein [BD1-7 clade bacterium]